MTSLPLEAEYRSPDVPPVGAVLVGLLDAIFRQPNGVLAQMKMQAQGDADLFGGSSSGEKGDIPLLSKALAEAVQSQPLCLPVKRKASSNLQPPTT